MKPTMVYIDEAAAVTAADWDALRQLIPTPLQMVAKGQSGAKFLSVQTYPAQGRFPATVRSFSIVKD